MAKSKLVTVNKKVEEAVVGGYKKIEEGAVNSFAKIADAFTNQFLTREGESVEDARKRLADEERARQENSIK